MKLTFVALMAFVCMSVANAATTIESIDQCTVALYKSNPWQKSYVVEGSRKTGLGANRTVNQIRRNGATEVVNKDVLGIARYKTLTLRTILETEGNAKKDPCRGMISASEVTVCTADGNDSTCETRCDLNWIGNDCR